jgi:putative ABC transport system substrate-binding protein
MLIAGLLLAVPLTGEGNNPGRVVRIGWLGLASPDPEVLRIVDGFKQGLREVGYVEGQNVAFEYRWADGRSERLPELAGELVRLKVDVIAVASTLGAIAARQATGTIPIILLGPDPAALGLGARLARPGGNVTGTTLVPGPEVGGKYLELLKEAAPKTSRVAVLMRPDNPSHVLFMKESEVAARSSRTRLQPVRAHTADELDAAFSAMARARADALIVLADPIFFLHRQRLAELSAKRRLPAMYGLTEHDGR